MKDFCSKFAAREADRDLGADGHLLSRTQNSSGRIVGDRISALQNFEWATFFESHDRGFESLTFRDEHTIETDLQIASVALPGAAQSCHPPAHIERGESHLR